MRSRRYVRLAAAMAPAVTLLAGSVRAATLTWTGAAGTTAGTYSTGTSNEVAVNYYSWGFESGNFDAPYNLGDDVLFDQASGNIVIAAQRYTFDPGTGPITAAMIPTTMTFTGGATYDFTRASTSANSGVFNGWTNTNAGFGADSFAAVSPFDSNGTSSLLLDENFTGKVIIRTRAPSFAATPGTIEIAGGMLEMHDIGALPSGTSNNNPSILLSGGTFAVNIDTGSYTFRQGNTQPAGGNMAGTMSVTANSVLANTAVDAWGRAREGQNTWNGIINVDAGSTLTIDTGGGMAIGANINGAVLSGGGTIKIGEAATNTSGANRLRIAGNLAAGSGTLNFDLGTTGILENGRAANSTTNLGSLVGGSGTLLRGSNQTATLTANVATIAIGANNASTTFAGIITNGSAASTGSGSSGVAPAGARQVLINAISKVGTGTLTLSGQNTYNGSTAVSAGTLKLGSNHAIGDGAANVVVATGGTLDFDGNSQVAGRSFLLTGGSLVNNGASAVTINNGASAGFVTTTAGGSGNWSGAGNSPTVSITGGGGTGATAQAVLHLGWIRFQTGDLGNPGSGYTKEPIITFSDPDLPNGRPIKVVVSLTNPGAAGGVAVAGINVIDVGYGYTSVPTVTINNAGTGGSGLSLTYAMTLGGVRITNAGSGYTSAPTVAFGGTGYVASSGVGIGNFGQVTVNTQSSIGGSGNMSIDPGITGTAGINKIGAGILTLRGTNTYAGSTTVNAGTLALSGSSMANAKVAVKSGAAFTMDGTSGLRSNITSALAADKLASESGAVVTLDGTLTVHLTGTYALGDQWDLFDISGGTANGFDTINLAGSYVGSLTETTSGYWTGTVAGLNWGFDESTGVLAVPEPSSLALLGLIGGGLLRRHRRRM